MTAGEFGFRLTDLAFLSAIVAAVAYGLAAAPRSDKKRWERMGNWAFGLHALSVVGIIALLWGLIFNKQYQYAYVYDHSSNVLPVEYIVSCLWEGQEGSFLLWMFWHSVLGLLLIWRAGSWRPGVMAVVSSVDAILASMVLGVRIGSDMAHWGLALLGLLVMVILLRDFFSWPGRLPHVARGMDGRNLIPVAAIPLLLMLWMNLALGHSGWWADALRGEPGFMLQLLYLVGFVVLLWYAYLKQNLKPHMLASGTALATLVFIVARISFDADFKIGSSPFLSLAQAFPTNETLQNDPNFVPTDGEGLNALLQNYWMVIHPPTLFLGFASTVVAFAYVLTALWQRRYADWIGPASPWAIFSVMILGVGIIMGGYWAYETLNFGGYWNWDPVENSSLVPWLVGVAGLHAMLSYRKSKRNLKAAMILMASTFVLVLYSTFLTRSGILGETSVHSFTDLGLSGQLLLLLFIYLIGVVLLFVHHWRRLPVEPRATTWYSREFFLFLAALVLAFTGIEILMVTSIPVFNKIFGTRMAPPSEVSFFYYRWNVWFGILIAALSAIGQFFYWTKIEKATLQKALFRPFLLAAVLTATIMVLLFVGGWQFAFQEKYHKVLSTATDGGVWSTISAYVGTGILVFADDLLLFASLFTLLANSIIIWRLVRRSRKNLRHTGGSLAHIGFGLMLLGILFSSGYEDTLSINLRPEQLEEGMGKEARTNVVLPKGEPTDIKEYRVIYRGVRPARLPFADFRVINSGEDMVQIGFADAEGYAYQVTLPVPYFLKSNVMPAATGQLQDHLNMEKLRLYIEHQARMLPIEMLNGRRLYTVDFYPLVRDDKGAIQVSNDNAFRLYPEAEAQGEQGLLAHPDRAIFFSRDIYTHVTGRPGAADATMDWTLLLPETAVRQDSSAIVDGIKVTVTQPERMPTAKELGEDELLTQLPLRIKAGDSTYAAFPKLMVNKKTGVITMIDDWVPQLGWRVRFSGVDLEEGRFKIAIAEQKPVQDYIILSAISKPYVNLLWLGTFVMTIGFLLAIWRRVSELQ